MQKKPNFVPFVQLSVSLIVVFWFRIITSMQSYSLARAISRQAFLIGYFINLMMQEMAINCLHRDTYNGVLRNTTMYCIVKMCSKVK